ERRGEVVMRSRICRRDASGATRRPMIPQPAGEKAEPPPARGSSAVDDVQLARGLVEPDGAIRAADHDVFDPGAVFLDEVDAGLDRERHPLAKRLVVAGDDV